MHALRLPASVSILLIALHQPTVAADHRYAHSLDWWVEYADQISSAVVTEITEKIVMVGQAGEGKVPALARTAVFRPEGTLKGRLPKIVRRDWRVEIHRSAFDPLPKTNVRALLFLRAGTLIAVVALEDQAKWGTRAYSQQLQLCRSPKEIVDTVRSRVARKPTIARNTPAGNKPAGPRDIMNSHRGFLRYRVPNTSPIANVILNDPGVVLSLGQMEPANFLILPADLTRLPEILRDSRSESTWDRMRAAARLRNYRTPEVRQRLRELLEDPGTVTLNNMLLSDGKSRGDRRVLAVQLTAADVLRSWGEGASLKRDPQFPAFYMDYAFPTRGSN